MNCLVLKKSKSSKSPFPNVSKKQNFNIDFHSFHRGYPSFFLENPTCLNFVEDARTPFLNYYEVEWRDLWSFRSPSIFKEEASRECELLVEILWWGCVSSPPTFRPRVPEKIFWVNNSFFKILADFFQFRLFWNNDENMFKI